MFISYSRRNRPFAERLSHDLRRAGLAPWLDLSDVPPGDDFEARILPAIAASTHVILLASPEAKASEWVRREVAEASDRDKTVVPLRLAGLPGTMPPEWERRNMIEDAATDYWGGLRRLAGLLKAPRREALRSLTDLLDAGQGTVADAAAELGGGEELTAGGRRFVKLPVAPSAYGMTWLFAPPEATCRWPRSLGVLFNFTSTYPGARHRESLQHWAGQVDAAEPWLVMVEGPVNRAAGQYELKAESAHEWADGLAAGRRVIEEFAKGRSQVGYYLNCLVPMAFEIGLLSTMQSQRRRTYHYDSRSGAYVPAFDGWQ